MQRSIVLLACALSTACASAYGPRLPPVYIGSYQGFTAEPGGRDVRITKPACTAVLRVVSIHPGESIRGFMAFHAFDPTHFGEPRCHEAGPYPWRHPRLPRQIVPGSAGSGPCEDDQIPTLDGCRIYPPRLPEGVRTRSMLIYLASDLPIDPYRLAYDLELAAAFRPYYPDLNAAIWNQDLATAGRLLERLIEDIPGSPEWSGMIAGWGAGSVPVRGSSDEAVYRPNQ